jgi:hypothetical protein
MLELDPFQNIVNPTPTFVIGDGGIGNGEIVYDMMPSNGSRRGALQLDPFQNIVKVNWGGGLAVVFFDKGG